MLKLSDSASSDVNMYD